VSSIKYIFFYYFSHDLRPCPGKGIKDGGVMIGGDNIIKGTEWEITEHEFLHSSFNVLMHKYPWPYGGDKKDE
jgi:hypothetical protein